MMEAIGQNSAIESTLDSAQNLNNDETNFKLNIVENSPHDDGDNNDDDDDDEVVEVNEEANKKATTNTQNVEVEYEDEDKMSQTSNNGPNKSNVECYEDDQVETEVDKNRSHEDRYITQKMEDENSYRKQLIDNQFNNKYKEITTKIIEEENGKEQKVEEEEEQKEKEIDAQVEAVVELKVADEPRTIHEVEDIEVESSEQNKEPPPPQIIDVSQVSEDDLLKSDDDDEIVEDAKEQSTKFLEDKENSDHTLRIEIEDSLDSCNNDSKDDASVVINDAETEAKPTQESHQTILIKDDNNTSNNETIDVDHPTRVEDDKDVVSISDEESQPGIQDEENQKQQSSAMDVDVDIVETVKQDHRDEVINLDDETQDGMNSDINIAQQEQSKQLECITINEESQDLTIEQKEQENCQNEDSKNAMDINENSLHSDEEMQQTSAQQDEERLNGIDGNSNEGLRIYIADEDDDGDNTQQSESEQKLQVSTHATTSANEEQNHATTTDMDNFAAENLSDDSDNLITSIKRQFLRNENSSILPKLNGEYKNSETDATQTVIHMPADAQPIEPTPIDNDDGNNDYSSNLKIVDEHSKDSFSKENSQHSDEASKSPHGHQHMLQNESDDEASRFSMASAQSSSTATSSSHQLVIDHQNEDIEPPPAPIQTFTSSNTLPLLPFKINLKRKLSQTSDTPAVSPPQQKMPHLDLQLQQSDATNETTTDLTYPILNGENMEQEEKAIVSEQTGNDGIEEVEQVGVFAETTKIPAAAEKSYQTSPARSSPLLNSLLLKKLPPPSDKFEKFLPPQKLNKTKYLCFNCKSGSYKSLVALNEHQHICLADKALLPEITTSTSPTTSIMPITRTQTPPVSPQQSLEKTISPIHNQQEVPETSLEKRRYYQCSSCRTYHENWNLFLHIREIHKRHTCLYCIRMFPTAEKLSLHLEIKHDLEQNHFNSEEALRKSIEVVEGSVNEARFLMCCTCQHVFLEHEHFSDHVCTEFMQACTLCGQKGRHTNQCKAQNEAKRSKVKKKSKVRDSTTAASLPHESSSIQSNPPSVMPQPEYASNMPHMLTTNCDNVQPSTLLATFQPSTTALPTPSFPQPQQHNEDSNSSCNMVIDETCNSTNYSRSAPYNPFKALDERERLEQQTDVAQPVLPPDRNQLTEQAAEKPEPVPLIVPKFKLRVPKEFQKSVDAVISSTESEDDEELVIHEDESDRNAMSNIKSTSSTTPRMDVDNESITEPASELSTFQEATEEHNKQPGVTAEDDDSLDEPNSNLVRILQEIERTKLDIMRTKETLHTSSKTLAAPRLATISQSSSRTGEHNWSPTPPASPNSQWYTPRRAISHGEGGVLGEMETKKEPPPPLPLPLPLENMAPPPLPIQKERRRYTTGSEVDMDIDETISGQPVQCIERPAHREAAPNEKDEAANISTESGVDKLSASTDGSFADIDVMNVSNAYMEDTNKTAPVDQEKEQSMDSVMPAQYEPVEQQAMPMKEIQAEEPPTVSENENLTKQEEIDIDVCSDKEEEEEEEVKETQKPPPTPPPPADGIAVADEETIAVDLQLDRPLEKFQTIEFVRICLKAVYPLCLYCNHARRIAVNGKSLVLHLIAQHRFAATVDSITAEELKPGTIVAKLKSYLPELEEHYFNSNSYCTFGDGTFTHHFNERIFECFQCRFVTSTHKELYLHNRKMHLKTAILCFMCRANFFSFSEILCHVCPGESHKISVFDVKFRCCLCDVDNIPSPFRLMVHLRKKHFACDVCLEDCRDQGRLSSHVWKHKLHHLCYRCGIAYRNKMDITKHLFWKHGTESIICKRCLQKRWRHVYHFCVPPVNFICDICNLCFSKATYLKVHKRIHTGDLRYPCTDENCEKKFISRRLLLKHTAEHQLAEKNESQSMPAEKENSEQQQETAAQVKDEQSIKIKEEVIEDVKQLPMKNESNYEPQQTETKSEFNVDKKSTLTETAKPSTSTTTIGDTSCKQRKKKKNKRNKESLEDLNLIAPNLSESDSSDDSDVESKSKSGDDSLVPKVMLSPTSDTENVKEDEGAGKKESSSDASGKVLDIWKNFLQSQGEEAIGDSSEPIRNATDYTEDYYPTPRKLHVAQSDHDYCVMFKPEPPKKLIEQLAPSQTSPHKRKTAKSPRRTSARRSEGSSGSSSGGSSGSSSDSSCSCGSNCSCSSSNSGSSSSSSSSNDSGDSSAASRTSRKRHRKKSERDRMRKKSESISPMKKHSMPESGGKGKLLADVDEGTETSPPPEPSEPMLPNEPLFYESDLETAESETDEEFYDEHPQKLATELLAQKRAQLMAQTRLSPSHNFDIVENSRPSTPSLPDDVARERKVKLKKKKRERKSTSRSMAAGTGVPPLKLSLGIASSQNVTKVAGQNQLLQDHQSAATHQSVPLNTATNMGPSYELMRRSSFGIAEISSGTQQQFNTTTHTTAGLQLTPRPIGPQHHMGRMSEGSSCSDADASLKRSKRARRPNKFYGYTSDEEHNMSGLGQPLMIGMRAIKPQPPPQLTWCKDDLPTPSKSIINNNKIKMPRTPKTPNAPHNPQTPGGSLFHANLCGPVSTLLKKNRGMCGSDNAKIRKRNSKKSTMSSKLPPIPTLKIRSSQIGQTPTQQHMQVPTVGGGTNHIPASQIYSSSKESDEDEDDEEVDSTDSSSEDDGSKQMTPSTSSGAKVAWNTTLLQANSATPTAPVAALILPQVAPAPPPPQAEAFNQKIPPALLPNPDFATLQYFKANNIRYPIRPPAGARQAREGESVYCYCRCPYDEVSEMIACDGENCLIEWFHFECVGIMVAPQGKWFCAECRPKYSEELYPISGTA